MNGRAREYDNIEDVRNFLSTARSVKLLQIQSKFFYEIEEVVEQSGQQSGQQSVLDDYIESRSLAQPIKLDKQVVDIGGNLIQFAVMHYSSCFK